MSSVSRPPRGTSGATAVRQHRADGSVVVFGADRCEVCNQASAAGARYGPGEILGVIPTCHRCRYGSRHQSLRQMAVRAAMAEAALILAAGLRGERSMADTVSLANAALSPAMREVLASELDPVRRTA